jgi:hypothetical protein
LNAQPSGSAAATAIQGEWDELVAHAIERREVPTESYLLDPRYLRSIDSTASNSLTLAA